MNRKYFLLVLALLGLTFAIAPLFGEAWRLMAVRDVVSSVEHGKPLNANRLTRLFRVRDRRWALGKLAEEGTPREVKRVLAANVLLRSTDEQNLLPLLEMMASEDEELAEVVTSVVTLASGEIHTRALVRFIAETENDEAAQRCAVALRNVAGASARSCRGAIREALDVRHSVGCSTRIFLLFLWATDSRDPFVRQCLAETAFTEEEKGFLEDLGFEPMPPEPSQVAGRDGG